MRFAVLGKLLIVNDASVLRITQLKQRMLLGVLLRYANRSVSNDLIIDALWGDRPPRSAISSVRAYVYHLRQALGDSERIGWVSPGYTLTLHPEELDAECFTELVARGFQARRAGDASMAGTVLSEALSLWRGRAYEGLTECSTLRDEAVRLEELRLVAVEERFSIDLGLGRSSDLIPEIRPLAAAHPLHEGFRAQLMLALYRSGRQAEALQVYQDARLFLTEELGIEPGLQLQGLQQAILTHDPSLLASPMRPRPEPLG